MKSVKLFASFVAMALTGGVAFAADVAPVTNLGLSGLMNISAGGYNYQSTDESTDTTDPIISGFGAVNIPLGDAFSTQLDAFGETVLTSNDAAYSDMFGIGGHLSWRNYDSGLVGIFGGLGEGSPTDEEPWNGGWIGLEGQAYLGDFTLYGQAAWLLISSSNDNEEGFDRDSFLVRGVGRYFVTDDAKIEAEVSYMEGRDVIDGDDDGKAWEWGVSGMLRLSDQMPIYGTLAYRGADYNTTTEGDDGEAHSVMAGVTFLFGGASLKENDRMGATLDSPTTVLRTSGAFSELD